MGLHLIPQASFNLTGLKLIVLEFFFVNNYIEFLKCNEANVRNAIVNIKNNRELGEGLKIPPSRLDEVDKLPPDDQKQRLVAEWFKVDTDCKWETLHAAIGMHGWSTSKSLSGNSSSFSEDPLSPPSITTRIAGKHMLLIIHGTPTPNPLALA